MRIILLLLSLSLVVAGWGLSAQAEDWPHWRGPHRNGTTSESSGWNGKAWPAGEPVWTGDVGPGSSSPIVADGRLYAIGSKDGTDQVICLDSRSGKQLWTQSYKCPDYGRHSFGDKGLYAGNSASPEYDSQTKFLYTLSTDGDLNCWDTAAKGKRVWGFNLYDNYKVPQRPIVGPRRKLRDYGYTTAPLAYGDWVIVEVGDDDKDDGGKDDGGNLMAFDKRTGLRRWTSESKDPAGHTGGLTPMVVEGIPCVAVVTIRNVLVTRLDKGNEGKTVAQYEWVTSFANNIATAAVHKNYVLVTSEYNKYAMCKLEITLDGAKKLWEKPSPSGVCSLTIHKGHVYWAWRGLNCLDFKTGEVLWKGGVFGDTASCLVTGDDRVIAWVDRGKLLLAETAQRSAGKYLQLAKTKALMKQDVWPHIVLADGHLYCKDRAGKLRCYEL